MTDEHRSLPRELERLRLSHEGERLTVTARGLLLTRELRAETSTEQVFDPREGWGVPGWRHDTYLGGLALDADEILRLADARARLLDVGAGLAAFPTEASILGLMVDCSDLELGEAHEAFERVLPGVRKAYPRELASLRRLSAEGGQRYEMSERERDLLERLFAARDEIAAAYPMVSGRRFGDDARTLATVPNDSYDLVVSAWLMVHLVDDDERRAVAAMVRVTRPGGTVRIKAGYGDDAVARFNDWYGAKDRNAVVEGRSVVVDDSSLGDSLVLRRCS
jgi:SAM-dependent methyltransferase